MTTHREVEIKCQVEDLRAFRRTISKLRARPVLSRLCFAQPMGKNRGRSFRVHEMNVLFDTPEGGLAKHGQLLRLRTETVNHLDNKERKDSESGASAARRAILTFKGPALDDAGSPGKADGIGAAARVVSAGRHKVREEIEVEVADGSQLAHILEALGMRGWFRYEKFRTTYQLPASARWAKDLLIELDETPIGSFVELEGPPDAIDRAAGLLGFASRDYITASYLALYLQQCRTRKITPGDMLFAAEI